MKRFIILSAVLFVAWMMTAPITGAQAFFGGSTTNNYDIDESIHQHNSNCNHNSNRNDNKNSNSNKNTNLNTNLNTNINGQDQNQGQAQGQLQGQGQGQIQGQTAHNEGVDQSVTFEAEPNHISPAATMGADAKLVPTQPFSHKAQGSFFGVIDSITLKQAKKASSGATDVTIETVVLFEMDYRTESIFLLEDEKDATGQFMGYLYVGQDGDDVTKAGAEAKAAARAMDLGSTDIVRMYDDSGFIVDGSAWNIGLGGGASIMSAGGNIAIAPNGGLGYGSAHSESEMRPAMVFKLFSDQSRIGK